MARLTGKVAVVTGASKGIGAGIAKAFGAAEASVVVNYASDKAGADRTVEAIAGSGGKAAAVQGDVSKPADVKRLFEETEKLFGPADVLVNNAAVYEIGPIEAISAESFHRQFDINVLGVLLATQAAVEQFGERGGNVLNIGSIASAGQAPGMIVYAATKGALETVTLQLAKELAARRIRVNCISPGYVATEGMGFLAGTKIEAGLIGAIPLGRAGAPDDIADVAAFLASDEARWITGEILRVSGGQKA